MIGQLTVLTAGMIWLAAGGLLLEVSRVLGPSYHTKVTVHWGWRALTWLGAVAFFARGVTLMFPGKLVEVSRISVVAPIAALAVLGVTAALLDWVMRDRAPPPWSVQAMRAVALLGRDGPVKFAALALPVPPAGAPLPDAAPARRGRLSILLGAVAVLIVIAAFVALNAPGGR